MSKGRGDPWKGSTTVLILATLAEEPRHGYAIAQEIGKRTNDLIALGEGSLYPALFNLESEGLIVSQWQPPRSGTGKGAARKVYTITDAGRARLAQSAQEVRALARAITQLLEGVPDAPEPSHG